MRTTRRAVLVAALCAVMTLVAVAYAAGRAKAVPVIEVVRATRFELVDGHGEVRASLRVCPDGTPALEMLNEEGKRRASLVGSDSMPSLGLGWEGKQGAKLNLGFNAAGIPILFWPIRAAGFGRCSRRPPRGIPV